MLILLLNLKFIGVKVVAVVALVAEVVAEAAEAAVAVVVILLEVGIMDMGAVDQLLGLCSVPLSHLSYLLSSGVFFIEKLSDAGRKDIKISNIRGTEIRRKLKYR